VFSGIASIHFSKAGALHFVDHRIHGGDICQAKIDSSHHWAEQAFMPRECNDFLFPTRGGAGIYACVERKMELGFST
jgi:hypothetical protein